METMSPLKAIRTFFEADGARKLSLDELKALTSEDRAELGKLAAEKLGVTLSAS